MRTLLLLPLLLACAAHHEAMGDADVADAACAPIEGLYELRFDAIDGDCGPLDAAPIYLDQETMDGACTGVPTVRSDCGVDIEIICEIGTIRREVSVELEPTLLGTASVRATAVVGSCAGTYAVSAESVGT